MLRSIKVVVSGNSTGKAANPNAPPIPPVCLPSSTTGRAGRGGEEARQEVDREVKAFQHGVGAGTTSLETASRWRSGGIRRKMRLSGSPA